MAAPGSGASRLRQALSRCDPLAESGWETVLRLLHMLTGITVDSQVPLVDGDGVLIARADLRIRGTVRVVEYDGAHHRTARRHRRDLVREKALQRLGLERYGYTAPEILGRPDRIVRDAKDASDLPHEPARLDRWRREVALSSLSESGRRRLRGRLGRFAAPGVARHLTPATEWRNAAAG